MILGNYSEDSNLLGTLGQLALGFLGVDLPADIRDLMYDITNWKLTPSHALQTILDAAALLPVIGSIKYTDEAVDVVKGVLKRGNDVAVLDKNLKPDELLNELANSGVKYNLDEVVAITKTTDDKLVWLEKGNNRAGLEHILLHADQFLDKGIVKEEIPDFIIYTLKNGKRIDTQNTRPIYEVIYKGTKQRIAISVSDNGFIVGANPKSIK